MSTKIEMRLWRMSLDITASTSQVRPHGKVNTEAPVVEGERQINANWPDGGKPAGTNPDTLIQGEVMGIECTAGIVEHSGAVILPYRIICLDTGGQAVFATNHF